jgi:predicted N-formylglutamate amidohydrolase
VKQGLDLLIQMLQCKQTGDNEKFNQIGNDLTMEQHKQIVEICEVMFSFSTDMIAMRKEQVVVSDRIIEMMKKKDVTH